MAYVFLVVCLGLVISFAASYFIARIFFHVLSKSLRKKFGILLSIDSIGIFTLKNILIERNEKFSIKIKKIALVPGFFDKEYCKPLNIVVGPVKVDLLQHDQNSASMQQKPAEKDSKDGSAAKQSSTSIFLSPLLYILQHIGLDVPEIGLTISNGEFDIVGHSRLLAGLNFKYNEENQRRLGVLIEMRDVAVNVTEDASPVLDCAFQLALQASVLPGAITKSCISKVTLSKLVLTCREGALKHAAKRQRREKNIEVQEDPVEHAPEAEMNSLIEKLDHAPKEVIVILENCKIVYVSSKEREIYLSWHCEFSWKRGLEENEAKPKISYNLAVDLTGFVVNTTHNKLLLNKHIECCMKLTPDAEQSSCSLICSLDTLHSSFIQEELEFWSSEIEIFSSVSRQPTSSSQLKSKPKKINNLMLLSRLFRWDVDVKLKNCSCDLMLTSADSRQSHLTLNSYLGELELKIDKAVHRGNFGGEFRCNVVLQDLYTYVNRVEPKIYSCITCVDGNDRPAVLPSSENHIWGRIMEIGKISFEAGCDEFTLLEYNRPLYMNASGEINFVAFEWSLAVAHAFKRTFQLISTLTRKSVSPMSLEKKSKQDTSLLHMDAELRVVNINLFCLGERAGGTNSLLTCMDGIDISTGSAEEPMLWQINGMKISRLIDIEKDKSFVCHGSKSLKTHIAHVPSISACFFRKLSPKILTVSIQDCSVDWDTTKHMVIYEQMEFILEAKDALQDILPGSKEEQARRDDSLKVAIKLDIISAHLKMQTSSKNCFGISTENLCLQSNHEELSAKACDVDVLFDQKTIFKFQEIELKKISSTELIAKRQNHPCIAQENSRSVQLSIHSCHILFPYKFDFASSLESLLNVTKMLKVLHKKPKKAGHFEPLPPDLFLKCNFLSFELEDDPFEVKIEENYLLRMDEMEECLERETKLIQKLNDIQGAFVSSKKVEEIMKSLAEKNAQIYIKRSMAIHQDISKRTFLLKCSFRDISLAVMADKSLHGKENVIEQMLGINSESQLPEDITFSTLWCRKIEGNLKFLMILVRDYQQPLLQIENYNLSGTLIGAEQTGSELATREAIVEIGTPWTNMTVKKNMPALKFYHDLSFDMDFFQAAWGVNFEPAFSMITQSLDLLSKASVDPSTPLPFWDKIRLLLHGTLKMRVRELNLVLSASRDPNNATEKMVIVWENVLLTWTNACIIVQGDFDLQIRTASKYDDSRVLHFPAFKLRLDLEWLCEGDTNDHHRAIPCDPTKVLSTKDHDSYRLFRSKNLNLSVNLETGKGLSKEQIKINPPTLFLYASTFRWFQKYRAVVLNNVSRPIRRGSYFNNVKPRKPTLGRHCKFVNIDLSVSRLRVNYFGSFTQDAGFEMSVAAGSFGVSYQVHVEKMFDDLDLIRRPVANWIVRDLRSELDKATTDLISSLPETIDASNEVNPEAIEAERPSKTYFLFSVKRVQYNRQSPSSDMSSYTHKVELNDFRGAWTALNRKITLELFAAYTNMEMLKRVLSSEALKATKDTESQDFRRQHKGSFLDLATSSPKNAPEQHISLLQQLVSEQQSKFMAQVEEGDNENEGQQKSPVEEDIIQLNWHIELTNSQVLLKGSESKAAMLITSASTQILKRLHRPVTANNDVALKLNKVTWTGKLSNLQYFATVKELSDLSSSSIPWLNASIFSDLQGNKESDATNNVAAFMVSSDCVGSIVNVNMNGITTELQRVVSPCQCEFYYVSLDPELDPFAEEFEATQYTSTRSNAAFSPPSNLANTLLIRHPSLEISTSPEQYAMFMEICQKLLLYAEPKKKEQQDRLEKMKFRMQLSTGQNIKGDILEMQDSVRDSLSYLRRCERQLFDYRRKADNISLSMDEDSFLEMTLELREATNDLQDQIEAAKEQLSAESEELKIMIRTYKDLVQNSSASPSPNKSRTKSYVVKQSDVIFDDMRWRLTQQDGQLGIADVQFKKFHYNKLTFDDNAGEHRFELGGFSVHNLIPNATYKEVLIPHEINLRRHVDKSVFLRVYCRVQSPVSGISIREHFEVNVCPIAVRLTHRFYHYLMSFFFPRKSANLDQSDAPEFDMGVKTREEVEDRDSQNDDVQGPATFKKPAPPRPPPPRPAQPHKSQQPVPQIFVKPPASQPLSLDIEAGERRKKKSSTTLTLASPKETSNPPVSPSVGPGSVSRTPSVKKSSSFYSRFSTDENVNRMRERAARNQTFIYIKIPEIPICFSYKGEKERNIEDAHDFNLLLPTLEYHNRTWTWQDLSMALKKDYTQVLVPQIIKEKLHLKGGWDNKQSMAKKGDEDKAKLLLGEQLGTQKKAGKKLLFGKLSNLLTNSKSSSESSADSKEVEKSKSAQLSGKGIDPLALHDKFERLRTVSSNSKEQKS